MKLPVEIPLFQIFQYGWTDAALNIDLVTLIWLNSSSSDEGVLNMLKALLNLVHRRVSHSLSSEFSGSSLELWTLPACTCHHDVLSLWALLKGQGKGQSGAAATGGTATCPGWNCSDWTTWASTLIHSLTIVICCSGKDFVTGLWWISLI